MNKTAVGDGTVRLLAGGGRVFTDLAARFVRSERSLLEIIDEPYSGDLVKKILRSGHKAALEFDYFVFGVEGYSRVAEIQLVRKRMASYMIKSGRPDKKGRRSFDVVVPRGIEGFAASFRLPSERITMPDGRHLCEVCSAAELLVQVDSDLLLEITEEWYSTGVQQGMREEDLRYLKPQATEFKAMIGMNAHALVDWFAIRCCRLAQAEIRDMANKMLDICRQVAPDIFSDAGAHCRVLGYCPENAGQSPYCRGKTLTKDEVMRLIADQQASMRR